MHIHTHTVRGVECRSKVKSQGGSSLAGQDSHHIIELVGLNTHCTVAEVWLSFLDTHTQTRSGKGGTSRVAAQHLPAGVRQEAGSVATGRGSHLVTLLQRPGGQPAQGLLCCIAQPPLDTGAEVRGQKRR